MRYSNAFIITLKEVPKDAELISHKLMYRSGMIRKVAAGVYEWLPLGFKVLKYVENIIREELDREGAQELLLPALQPKQLWDKSKRWDVYGKELVRLQDRHDREFCLGPTHEEVITSLVANEVRSYRQLPFTLYQFQTKFRDEIRPRFGVMRAREFLMKDAYSFDKTDADSEENYKKMYKVYSNIFTRLGLDYKVVEADSGAIGGSFSHEFMVLAKSGEDRLVSCSCGYASNVEKAADTSKCPKCGSELSFAHGIEVGHIFKLGTKYSDSMGAFYLDENGKRKPIVMGCYGIGVSRIVAASIEQNYDEKGIIWPWPIAPYQIGIICVDIKNKELVKVSTDLYNDLKKRGYEVLLDDRRERPGVKFNDMDLLGLPLQIIIGKKFIEDEDLEIKIRKTNETFFVKIKNLEELIKKIKN